MFESIVFGCAVLLTALISFVVGALAAVGYLTWTGTKIICEKK